ncbi:unnamed protein product (macronuclear) [Paramecium tetraurelia]|uniref:Uncharacterized protein n=1 Tax=Paramecium tetraurelia TaxID=5888 RepID=A0CP03_PARTE|nr:uncharacterized protein GSPATT00038789001 [Paramecium tetraurelia]CAK72520.1 unnamed protein product [Paramecium tetraurelia]|eukprot:XP_001439917.1 hypothetical protein (macronuclear) [Paramecium tetraurelia strain d4-2]
MHHNEYQLFLWLIMKIIQQTEQVCQLSLQQWEYILARKWTRDYLKNRLDDSLLFQMISISYACCSKVEEKIGQLGKTSIAVYNLKKALPDVNLN